MYELQSENLTGLGGPMGIEYTSTNFRPYLSPNGNTRPLTRCQ